MFTGSEPVAVISKDSYETVFVLSKATDREALWRIGNTELFLTFALDVGEWLA